MSKYKNSAPKLVKKEQCLSGISTNRLSNTIGSLINCSLKHLTFAFDSNSGGSICTVRIDDLAKRPTFSNDSLCITHAHSGPITDIQYNMFNQKVMATTGYDAQIQLWSIGNDDDASQPVRVGQKATLQLNESRCDCVQWNPNVEDVMVSTSLNTIYLWDVENSNVPVQALRNHNEAIQSITWRRDGSLLVSAAKDKTMQIIDPRNMKSNENLRFDNAKTSNKDSKLVWIGTSDCILSSVYTPSHQREIHLWDIRNTNSPVHETQIDTGNNVLTPLYDYDTSMLFLVGKAETIVRYCEVFLSDPWNIQFNSTQQVEDQIKGVCMLPKFGLDIMKCEIDRLFLLTRNSVYPLPYYVPRRSYYDFHADIFPETYNICEPGIKKREWLDGKNADAVKTVFNPTVQMKYFNSGETRNGTSKTSTATSTAPTSTTINNNSSNSSGSYNSEEKQSTAQAPSEIISSLNKLNNEKNNAKVVSKPLEASDSNQASLFPSSILSNAQKDSSSQGSADTSSTPSVVRRQVRMEPATEPSHTISSNGNHGNGNSSAFKTSSFSNAAADRKSKVKSVYYQSKYKYINGKAAHKNEHITNIRNLSTMWPSECNGFQINAKHAAILLAGTSGQIGIIELNKPGRLADTTINSIVNRSKVSDFAWDPFDDESLAAACDDGIIRIWKIPEEGLENSLETPEIELRGHLERLYCIKYHPYAKDLLATASYDRTIRLWNVKTKEAVVTLKGHTDVVFSMSWSLCGYRLATICKDGVLRVYEPLASDMPIVESKCGPSSGSKAARIEWVLQDRALLVSGFGKGNLRQIYLFDSETLEQMQSEDINQSPSLLIPYFDSDINVLYLYAKGEETIYIYEIQEDEPYFQALTPFKPESIHLAIAFMSKIHCDIRSAEISKAYRLTKDNRIEKMSFTVPRVKLGLFQDDIYPDTIDKSKPYLHANQWFSGAKFQLRFINLQPPDMQRLTDTQSNEPAPIKPIRKMNENVCEQKRDLYNPDNLNTDEKKNN